MIYRCYDIFGVVTKEVTSFQAFQMPLSLISQLTYSNLAASVEDAAVSIYGRIRSYIESELAPLSVDITIHLLLSVHTTPDGVTAPNLSTRSHLNHERLSISDDQLAIANYRRFRAFLDELFSHLAADVTVDVTMTVRPPPIRFLVSDEVIPVHQDTRQGEALCMALTKDEYQAMIKETASPEQPVVIPDYNHRFWPSPTTKRFAKQIAMRTHDDTVIKTHQNALDFLAKRANITVEDLLKMSQLDYQKAHAEWSI